mmetsp:Transcript_56314/g.149927  ORF Transcript_56314/g.149927 Transcript_56314/m.149927 type:complete len:208 (-) Transcript_56314:827-1450(-)
MIHAASCCGCSPSWRGYSGRQNCNLNAVFLPRSAFEQRAEKHADSPAADKPRCSGSLGSASTTHQTLSKCPWKPCRQPDPSSSPTQLQSLVACRARLPSTRYQEPPAARAQIPARNPAEPSAAGRVDCLAETERYRVYRHSQLGLILPPFLHLRLPGHLRIHRDRQPWATPNCTLLSPTLEWELRWLRSRYRQTLFFFDVRCLSPSL